MGRKTSGDHKIGMGITGNRVTSIQCGGAVERWNMEHPHQQIILDSMILEVNGKRSHREMRDEIKRSEGLIELCVHVPSPPSSVEVP